MVESTSSLFDEIRKLEERLKTHEVELKGREQDLETRSSQVQSELTRLNTEKTAIATERSALEGQRKQIEAKDRELVAAEARSNDRQREFAKREGDLQANLQKFTAAQKDLQTREQALVGREAALVERESALRAQEAEIGGALKEASDRRTLAIASQEQAAKSMEDHKNALTAQVAKGRELLEREKRLAKEEQDLAAMRLKITGDASTLLGKEKELLAREKRLASVAAAPVTIPPPMPAVPARTPERSEPEPAPQVVAEPEVVEAETAAEAPAGESEIACPSCGTVISADAIMCYACGERIAREEPAETGEIPCPSCGTSISSDAIMCYACGHRLQEEKGDKKPGGVGSAVKKVLKKRVV